MTSKALPDSVYQNWNSMADLPYYLTPPLSSTQPSFPDTGIYDYNAITENAESQQHGATFDRQDQPLFGPAFDNRCESLQHEGPDIVKLEDHFPQQAYCF